MEKTDIYKLCYQGAFGPAHAVSDAQKSLEWLRAESQELKKVPSELYEEISHDGRLVRVNLYPYIKNGGDIEKLNHAFIETGRIFKGSAEVFKEYLRIALDILDKAVAANTDADSFGGFLNDMEQKGYPVTHHSQTYRENYFPAYRVVLRELVV